MILQKEKEQQSEQHEQTVQKLQAKHETDMSHLHQEHALSAAKVQITTTPPHDSPCQPAKFTVGDWCKYKIVPNLTAFIFSNFLSVSLFQASEVMEDFEKSLAQLKQQLLDSEHRRHQQVRVWFGWWQLCTYFNVYVCTHLGVCTCIILTQMVCIFSICHCRNTNYKKYG